jgi:hypothetical protein
LPGNKDAEVFHTVSDTFAASGILGGPALTVGFRLKLATVLGVAFLLAFLACFATAFKHAQLPCVAAFLPCRESYRIARPKPRTISGLLPNSWRRRVLEE